VNVAVFASTGARAASRIFVSADAFAISTASAATRSASSTVTICEAAKPHAPSAIARTPNPNESARSALSSRPFFTSAFSSSRRTKRTSAYDAPRFRAVSSARLARSRSTAKLAITT
jgi:hypothetical protein